MNPAQQIPLVLVVDDDSTMRLLVRETLEASGFAVEEAEDGRAGVTAFQRCAPDIVLLDVLMPKLDGFGACAALRALPAGSHTPVLMMTGLDDSESINRAFEAGATDFITKPIVWPMLGHRVRYLLRASRAFRELAESQQRLAKAQRIAQLGHWNWVVASGQVELSAELAGILGLAPEQMPATYPALLDLIDPNDRDAVHEALYAALYRGQPCNVNFRITHRDGSARAMHAQGEVSFDATGAPVRLDGTLQDVTERKQAEERIRHLALYDSLTGLPNRQMFKEQLARAVAQAERSGQPLAMLSIDLDRFKRVNDTFGHAVGDSLLKEIAGRLTRALRQGDLITRSERNGPEDCVARPGGDEFTVLLAPISEAQDAAKVARRVLDVLSRPCRLDGNEIVVSASIGITVYPLDGADENMLLKNADAAMYHAKEQGKNNYQYYNRTMNTRALEKLTLEMNLRKALERGELLLYYQPKIEVVSGAITGAEALIRWRHPELGLVPPAEFIPLAEETGLIVAIGEWAVREACAQMRAWHDAGLGMVQIAVNMSSHNFKQENLGEVVEGALRAHRLPANCLELEMTESMLMQDVDATVEALRRLKAMGVRLSIDDFGTGYSSLSYLKRFPIDALKIDRSFVRDITSNPDDAAITAAIVAMAKALKLAVIAEGVETEAQAACLRRQGCHHMQGFLYSHPLPAEDFAGVLRERRSFAAPTTTGDTVPA